jgi:hypothetical protein
MCVGDRLKHAHAKAQPLRALDVKARGRDRILRLSAVISRSAQHVEELGRNLAAQLPRLRLASG